MRLARWEHLWISAVSPGQGWVSVWSNDLPPLDRSLIKETPHGIIGKIKRSEYIFGIFIEVFPCAFLFFTVLSWSIGDVFLKERLHGRAPDLLRRQARICVCNRLHARLVGTLQIICKRVWEEEEEEAAFKWSSACAVCFLKGVMITDHAEWNWNLAQMHTYESSVG